MSEGLRFTGMRSLSALSQGKTPGPEQSISKLVYASMAQDIAATAVDLQDQFGMIRDEGVAAFHGAFQEAVLGSPGSRIAGGTDEILRNIIAERVLGPARRNPGGQDDALQGSADGPLSGRWPVRRTARLFAPSGGKGLADAQADHGGHGPVAEAKAV
jgi:hypothetical protein